MSIAQRLYENGLITYRRTDSPTLSGQAINAARNEVEKQYGKEYLFERVRNFGKKKGAQEAHEAIRPAGSSFVHPEKSGWTKDRKSTRLNSSHVAISYAVFCLKKKNQELNEP